MKNFRDSKSIINYLNCLSVLEKKTSLVYQSLSEKVEMPKIRKILENIGKDSSKHSNLLQGLVNKYSSFKDTDRDCVKKLGKTWDLVDSFLLDLKNVEKISRDNFSLLLDDLLFLESSFGEEYYVFLQMKTLFFMAKEIDKLYDIDFGSTKQVFSSIVDDEEYHRELLGRIKDSLSVSKVQIRDNTPKVKYQNPDSWL